MFKILNIVIKQPEPGPSLTYKIEDQTYNSTLDSVAGGVWSTHARPSHHFTVDLVARVVRQVAVNGGRDVQLPAVHGAARQRHRDRLADAGDPQHVARRHRRQVLHVGVPEPCAEPGEGVKLRTLRRTGIGESHRDLRRTGRGVSHREPCADRERGVTLRTLRRTGIGESHRDLRRTGRGVSHREPCADRERGVTPRTLH